VADSGRSPGSSCRYRRRGGDRHTARRPEQRSADRESAVGLHPPGGTILDAIGNTPLVMVDGIWAMLEYLNPSGSIKGSEARLARHCLPACREDEPGDAGRGGLGGGERVKPGAVVRVGGVEQPTAQLGDDTGALNPPSTIVAEVSPEAVVAFTGRSSWGEVGGQNPASECS
jgi:hypothetical protein